jgi:formylglycine-generating enzyme required for sulfatase activity
MSEINVQKWSPMYWIARGAEAFADAIEVITSNYKPPFECPDGKVPVPGGKIRMEERGENGSSYLINRVEVKSLCWDKNEATISNYDAWGLGHRSRLLEEGSNEEKQPAVGVNWNDADAYCRARGERLPTRAEWKYAATGPSGVENAERFVKDSDKASCGAHPPEDVCTHGLNGYGLCDMIGSVAEWSSDDFGWYTDGGGHRVTNGMKILLGGYNLRGFWGNECWSANAYQGVAPDTNGWLFGVRCVVEPADK